MGLVYEFSNKEDRIYPLFLCDHCGEQIKDAHGGNVLWEKPEFEGKGPWRTNTVYFVHKKCNRAFEAEHPGLYWEGLSRFPIHLCYHLGMKDVAKLISEEEAKPKGSLKRSPQKPNS